METEIYRPTCIVRCVITATLLDGHDASTNIMRRILQVSGVDVIVLRENQSVDEFVDAAIQGDAQGIVISSYQGGHVEYLKHMLDMLKQKGAGYIKIFVGGGDVIIPSEIQKLHAYGIINIFSSNDDRQLGLQRVINLMIREMDFPTPKQRELELNEILENYGFNVGGESS